MKILYLAALVMAVAAQSNCDQYATPVERACTNYLVEFPVIDGGDGNTIPGSRWGGSPNCGVNAGNSIFLPGFALNSDQSLTVDLPAGAYTGAQLQLAFDNDLKGCFLNGNLIPGTNLQSGHCCHVSDVTSVDIPDDFWALDNTLECIVGDYSSLAFFDVAVCGDVVGPLNPNDPICRQTFLGDDGELHLVSRPDFNDTMGCVSDEECIEHTGPDSWCKADGSCRGCDDWTGCCDTAPQPEEPEFPCEEDSDCAIVGECSYCVNGHSCFPCEDGEPEPTPQIPDINGVPCGDLQQPDEACKELYGDCSYCQENGVTCKECYDC